MGGRRGAKATGPPPARWARLGARRPLAPPAGTRNQGRIRPSPISPSHASPTLVRFGSGPWRMRRTRYHPSTPRAQAPKGRRLRDTSGSEKPSPNTCLVSIVQQHEARKRRILLGRLILARPNNRGCPSPQFFRAPVPGLVSEHACTHERNICQESHPNGLDPSPEIQGAPLSFPAPHWDERTTTPCHQHCRSQQAHTRTAKLSKIAPPQTRKSVV